MKSSRRIEKVTEKKSKTTPVTQKRLVTKKVNKKPLNSLSSRLEKQSKIALRSTLLSPLFQKSVKIVAITIFISTTLYGVYQLIGKTFANEVVISKSEIVSRVAKLTPLPTEPPYDVVRVEDETDLKKQNEFYKDVKEGDYILMYKEMAIIYDLRSNSIVATRKMSKESGQSVEREQKTTRMSPKEMTQTQIETPNDR